MKKKMMMVVSVVLFCSAIACHHDFIDLGGECESDLDCADGDDCTVNICNVDNVCVLIPSDNPTCDPPPDCVPTDEVCDGLDNDCDGETDEGVLLPYYVDADRDGWGSESFILEYHCAGFDPGPGLSGSGGDCDNLNPVVHPTAPELCDHLDNDCDTETDEDYQDSLGDTCVVFSRDDGLCSEFGVVTCAPEGMYQLACNELPVGTIWSVPLSIDMCGNGLDDNCDGTADEGCGDCVSSTDCDDGDECTVDLCEAGGACRHLPSGDPSCEPECSTEIRYRDEDGDGYGDPEFSGVVCVDAPPVEGARVAGDCDDHDATVHPSATEICDELDNDCDGETDEGVTETRYFDYDNDGYGDAELPRIVCVGAPLTRLTGVRVAGDCNDRDASSHPGVYDYCDGLDNDCDNDTDEADGVHVEELEDLPVYDAGIPILGFRVVNDTCNVVQLRYLIEELHRVDDGSTVLDPCGIFDCSAYVYGRPYIHGYQSGREFYLTTGGFDVERGCLTGRTGGWVDLTHYTTDMDHLGNYLGSPPAGGYIDIVVTASIRPDAPSGQYQFMLKDYWMNGAQFDSIRTFTCDGAERGDGTPVPSASGVPILGPVFTVP